jgi:hypothetical protein
METQPLSHRLEHVVGNILERLVKQASCRGLLVSTCSIDSTHIGAIQYNNAASWNCDPPTERYKYDFGCTIVSIVIGI